MKKIDLFLRSLLFSIVMILATMIYSFFCVLAFPLPLQFRCNMIVAWTRFIIRSLKVICRIDYHLEGAEHLKQYKNGVVLSKHQSTWETFFLPGLLNGPAIILKRELLWVPFFGWGLAIMEPIAINRSSTKSAMQQIIAQGKKCLDNGRWILVFPEGTRIPYGKVGKYKIGGARLAVETGYPVIPIAHNAGKYWSKRKFIKRPGTIKVVIGPPIPTQGRSAEEVLEEAKSWIEAHI